MIRNPASCITLRINMPCTFQNIEGLMKHALRQTQSSWNHVKSLAPHHCPIAGSSFCQKLSAVALLVPPAGLPSPALRDLHLQKGEKCHSRIDWVYQGWENCIMKTYKGLEQRCLFLLQICIFFFNGQQIDWARTTARWSCDSWALHGRCVIKQKRNRNHQMKWMKWTKPPKSLEKCKSDWWYTERCFILWVFTYKWDRIVIEFVHNVHNSFQHVAEAVQTTASWSPGLQAGSRLRPGV